MRHLTPIIAWLAALAILLLRATCRIRRHGDPRAELKSRRMNYAYAFLHAHQVSAIIDGEPGTGAMVSRSRDGEIIVPSLLARGIVPIRGSSNRDREDKGGRAAFQALASHLLAGAPAFLAVDGPRGPRNRVHRGIALLSQRTGVAVLNAVPVPSRRWILSRSWDRLQIPKPFSTINVYFSEPLLPRSGEECQAYCDRIEASLNDLELKHDHDEAVIARIPSLQRHSEPGEAATDITVVFRALSSGAAPLHFTL